MTVRAEEVGIPTAAQREARPRSARVTPPRPEHLRAPFSLRCGALLIDYTIPVAILAFATLVARILGGDARWAGTTVLTLGYITVLVVLLLNLVVLVGLSGRTIGKWVTGLRVERRDGMPLSMARASLRHLVGYPLTLATLGVGFLVAAFNREGRALHDLVAGTIVVRGRGGGNSGADGEVPSGMR
jgi:uncharacterized RDD family membrane protein YckC